MTEDTFRLVSHDGLQLQGKYWSPDSPPRAVVCIVHGFGEHIHRYAHVAEVFTTIEVATIGFDHRGHGRSEGPKGHTPSYEHLLNDVDQLMEKADELFPEIPKVIYGHSMGGNIVLNYVLGREPSDLMGVIASSPWLKLPFDPPAIKAAASKLFRNIWPSLALSTDLDASAISRNKEEVKAYENDPLVHDKMSSELFLSCAEKAEEALKNAADWHWPLLLFHGTEDQLTGYQGSKEFASKAQGNIHFETFEGGYHETHNDIDKERLFSLFITWMEELLGEDGNKE